MGKIKTIAIFAAGYVVGARAGHKRYEQIKNWVQEMWGKPVVQEQVDKAGEQAGKLTREAKEHLPGSSNGDKKPADQGSTDSGTNQGVNGSGHTPGSTSNKESSSSTGSETTAGAPQDPNRG